MKALGSALCLTFLFISCAGLASRELASLDSRRVEELQSLDVALLDFTMNGDRSLVERVEKRTTELLSGDIPNREYRAELLGLLGLAQFQLGKSETASKTTLLIERESPAEPRLYLLRALLLKDAKQQIVYLTESLPKAGRKGPLLLMLALRHFAEGEYRRSLAEFDEAFPTLPARYREHYQGKRDLAFRFIDQAPGKTDTRELFAKSELSLEDFILITRRETRYLETMAADKNTPAALLLTPLKDKGYLRDDKADPTLAIRRRDAAYFVVRLMAALENNPGLPDRYAGAVRAGTPSPVPDLSPSDYFYSAALVLVERELFDLPDGRHFFPDKTLSGADYFEVLKKLKTRYGR
jgi:hypothetical protein